MVVWFISTRKGNRSCSLPDRRTERQKFGHFAIWAFSITWNASEKTGVTTKLKFPGDGQRLTTWTALQMRTYRKPCILINASEHGISWRTSAIAAQDKWSTIHFYLHDFLICSLTLEGMWTLFGRPRLFTFVNRTGGGRHATRLTPDILLNNRFQKTLKLHAKSNMKNSFSNKARNTPNYLSKRESTTKL